MDYWKRAKEYGIDLSLLKANLKKTATERVLDHQRALDFRLALEEAGRRYYASQSKTDRKARRQRS